jgi:hypothetical protein
VTGEGIAAIVASVSTLVGILGNIVLQLRQMKVSAGNSEKIDANTKLTQETAQKLEEVHAATAALIEVTGTHQILK